MEAPGSHTTVTEVKLDSMWVQLTGGSGGAVGLEGKIDSLRIV